MTCLKITKARVTEDSTTVFDVQMKTIQACNKIKITAASLRVGADKVDQVWRDCKISHASRNYLTSSSDSLTLAGATAVTEGTALLTAGVGLLFSGAATNIVASKIESSINSVEIKKAEKLWGGGSRQHQRSSYDCPELAGYERDDKDHIHFTPRRKLPVCRPRPVESVEKAPCGCSLVEGRSKPFNKRRCIRSGGNNASC